MILAAISFSDPLMLAGLLAALIPLLLHLLNRIRAPIVAFPTLRFLRITAQKTARRRQIQQYFLLLVRILVFVMIALAIASPLIHGGSPALAYGFIALSPGAAALLVLGGISGAAAVEGGKATGKEAAVRRSGSMWTASVIAIVMALLLAGFSAYGLASDRFFSGTQGGQYTGRSTAMVIIFDNSYSMLAKQDSLTRLARAKEMTRQLLTGALQPAEAAIVPTNLGERGASVLTADTTKLVGLLDTLQPAGATQPMRERINTALAMLGESHQANRMLVIVSDFARPAFSDAEIFSGVRGLSFGRQLQLVMMPVGGESGGKAGGAAVAGRVEAGPPADVGIVSLALSEGSERPALGGQATLEATLINNGDAADVRDFQLTVDGQAVPGDAAISRVQLGAAGTPAARATVRVPLRLTLAGQHRYGLRLQNAADAMAWDDQREMVLDVAQQIKVLVIGAEDNEPRARSAAFYFLSALAPFENRATTRPGQAAGLPWAIEPTYRGFNQVRSEADLAPYAAVFACDIPTVSTALADGLARFAGAGNRLVWVLGPSINAAAYNQLGRGLLPGRLAAPIVSAAATPVEWVDQQSGVFANLFENLEPYRSLLVTGRWALEADPVNGGNAAGAKAIAKLADLSPLIMEQAAGAQGGASLSGGKIYTILTSPAAAWSNLGATVLLVPLASRMALGSGGGGALEENDFDTGQRVSIRMNSANAPASIDVTTPGNAVINVRAAGGEYDFTHAQQAGLYQWKSSDGRQAGMFAVNPPGEEADLFPADVDALARQADGQADAAARPAIVAGDAVDLLAQLQARGEGASLMPGLIAMVVMLAIAEALLANRQRGMGAGRESAEATTTAVTSEVPQMV